MANILRHSETSEPRADVSDGVQHIQTEPAGSGSGSCQSDELLPTFPRFSNLPIELRYRIWEAFCPDLTASGRVYEFELQGPMAIGYANLSIQTAAARAMLATHRESRAIALKRFPDTLTGQPGNVVRFNKETDIVYLPHDYFAFPIRGDGIPEGFYENIRHLAINPLMFASDLNSLSGSVLFQTLQVVQLKTLYLCFQDTYINVEDLQWCTSSLAHNYHVHLREGELHLLYDVEYIFCWPDHVKNRDFAEKVLQIDKIGRIVMRFREAIEAASGRLPIPEMGRDSESESNSDSGSESNAESNNNSLWTANFEIWPLIDFGHGRGMRRFNQLLNWNGDCEDWDSTDDSDESDESDESD